MPRGIPAYKSDPQLDQIPLKFTSIHIPSVIPITGKLTNANYVRNEQQSIFTRTEQKGKRKRLDDWQTVMSEPPITGPRGSNVIVIHPGSRYVRIGRASDLRPLTVPHVIARQSVNARDTGPSLMAHPTMRMMRMKAAQQRLAQNQFPGPVDVTNPFDPTVMANDQAGTHIALLRSHMRGRLSQVKLKLQPNAAEVTFKHNSESQPSPVEESNESYQVNWTVPKPGERFIVGQRALDLPNPGAAGYVLQWPFKGSNFNYVDYRNLQALLNDIETIWSTILTADMGIPRRTFKNYSVMLLIPDFYELHYVRELVNLLISSMDFQAVCVQQESLCGMFGAGLSSACVVDMGAQKMSVACIEDGILVPETRMNLNFGGDDITFQLNNLLERIHFPCVDLDPGKAYDWRVLEDVKHKACTLAENDLASNPYDIVVRRPGVPPLKYRFRLYDEVLVAPTVIFEPRVVEFEKKAVNKPVWNPEVEDLAEFPAQVASSAMSGSTQHIFDQARQSVAAQHVQLAQQAQQIHVQQAQQQRQVSAPSTIPPPQFNPTPSQLGNQLVWKPPILADGGSGTHPNAGSPAKQGVAQHITPPASQPAQVMHAPPQAPPPQQLAQPRISLPPVQVNLPIPQPQPLQLIAPQIIPFTPDIPWEASKIPLDIAVFNSTRAAGTQDKSKKFLQSVLIIGGSSLIPGLIPALESRLHGLSLRYLSSVEHIKIQVITPPKDTDPRIVAWKGAALFSKLESVSDMWIKSTEWEILGTRAFHERMLFMSIP